MSYVTFDYRTPGPVAYTPDEALAPVPGWGTRPEMAGPRMLSVDATHGFGSAATLGACPPGQCRNPAGGACEACPPSGQVNTRAATDDTTKTIVLGVVALGILGAIVYVATRPDTRTPEERQRDRDFSYGMLAGGAMHGAFRR